MAAPTPIQATTQEHLDIEEIVENLIVLKDGSCAIVITTTAVNFGLLSESEQDATIYAYAALLNSLTFPIQVLIRSSRKDISGYEKLLSEQESRTINPENRERIRAYREFIQETVRERNLLDKKFYIVIPFSVLELGVAKSATALAKGTRRGLPFPQDYIVNRAKMTLEPKFDHLAHQLGRLGLRARQLTTRELIQLMFEFYNPDSAQGQILAAPEEYETPLVKPAVAFQETPQIVAPEEKKPYQAAAPITKPNTAMPVSPSTGPAKPSPPEPSLAQPNLKSSQPISAPLPESPREGVQPTPPSPPSDPQSLINSAVGEGNKPQGTNG